MAQHPISGRLFAYGTLIFPDVVHALLERTPSHGPAHLPGHTRFAVRGRSYPGLVPAEKDVTPGVLWEGIDPSELAIVDRYESDLYERRCIAVLPNGGGAPDEAAVYVVPDRHRGILTDRAWDPDHFVQEHLEATVAYCTRFRRSLAATCVS